MKNKILPLTLAASIFLSQLGSAEITPSQADNYPVNYAKCNFIVSVPEGSGGYLHSLDCKTVYILPSRVGTFKATPSLNEFVLKNMCPLFDAHQVQYNQKAKLLLKTQEQINLLETTGKNEKEIERLQKIAMKLEGDLGRITDPFRNVEGGKASFTMTAATSRELINKFYEQNQNLVYSRQIKFEPMPIQTGYLTMTQYQPNDKTIFPSSLAVYVNAMPVKVEGLEQNIFKMQSTAAGQIVLGIAKACAMYNRKETSGKELIAELAPTFSYTYPVMSMVKYEASIDVKRAAELLLNTEKVKGQFHVSEFSTLLGQGSASDIFTMQIDLQDLGDRFTTPEERQSFLANLTKDVRDRLTEKFLRELEVVSVVKYEKEANAAIPEPGYVTSPIGTVRTCSNSSFLGVTYNRSCHDRVVTRTIPVDGTLNDTLKKIQDFHITVEEHVSIRELINHGDNVVFE